MTQSLSGRSLRVLVFIGDYVRHSSRLQTVQVVGNRARRSQPSRPLNLPVIHRGRHGTARAIGLTSDGARIVIDVAKSVHRHPAGNRRSGVAS